MLNKIWLFMMALSIVWGTLTGRLTEVTEGALAGANSAVQLVIGIAGMMTMWMGIMKIAEKSGLMNVIGSAIRPAVRRIFPDVPPQHPAMGAMVMNIAANMLGLGNAATPFGIKAMQELQTLNTDKHRATNAMVTFLAINTASVTIIPATVIGLRAAAGAENPQEIVGPTLIVTIITTGVAIAVSKLLQGRKGRR